MKTARTYTTKKLPFLMLLPSLHSNPPLVSNDYLFPLSI